MRPTLKLTLVLLVAAFASCKSGPTDEQLQQQLSSMLSGAVTASVKDGVVTLNGTCPDEPCKTNSENSVKNTKGVKSVVNNITVSAPAVTTPATPEITVTDSLRTSVEALVKSYKTVHATVDSGVVTLTGEIKRSQLTTLMQSVNELKPKRVKNKLIIK